MLGLEEAWVVVCRVDFVRLGCRPEVLSEGKAVAGTYLILVPGVRVAITVTITGVEGLELTVLGTAVDTVATVDTIATVATVATTVVACMEGTDNSLILTMNQTVHHFVYLAGWFMTGIK